MIVDLLHSSVSHDTQVTCNTDVADTLKVLRRGMEKKINLRKYEDGSVCKMRRCIVYIHIYSVLTIALYPGSKGEGKNRAWCTPLAHALKYSTRYRMTVMNDIRRERDGCVAHDVQKRCNVGYFSACIPRW